MTKKETQLVEKLMLTPKKEWAKASNSRGPYHGNAYMLDKGGYSLCISYDTPIALMTPKREVIRLWNGYTKTSLGHFNDWAFRKNLPYISGKVWNDMLVGKKYAEGYIRCMPEIHKKMEKAKKAA